MLLHTYLIDINTYTTAADTLPKTCFVFGYVSYRKTTVIVPPPDPD